MLNVDKVAADEAGKSGLKLPALKKPQLKSASSDSHEGLDTQVLLMQKVMKWMEQRLNEQDKEINSLRQVVSTMETTLKGSINMTNQTAQMTLQTVQTSLSANNDLLRDMESRQRKQGAQIEKLSSGQDQVLLRTAKAIPGFLDDEKKKEESE